MRVPPLPADQWDDAVDSALAVMLPEERRNPENAGNILATFVDHPDADQAFLRFNVHLLFGSTLPPRLRELAILRVAHRTDCDIRVGAPRRDGQAARPHRRGHRRRATRRRRPTSSTARCWPPSTNSTTSHELSDETWAALGEHLDERQRMDFVFTVGCYVHAGHGLEHFWRRARDQEEVNNVALFPKPAAGSWTENWPELGTAPVDYSDSIDPEHWKLEQQAIFKKTWLNVGRVERLPKKGSYFTREMPSVGPGHVGDHRQGQGRTSVRAFHNMCRHRGNKLVWSDYPGEEVSGTCRQFTCKYHAWRYASTAT